MIYPQKVRQSTQEFESLITFKNFGEPLLLNDIIVPRTAEDRIKIPKIALGPNVPKTKTIFPNIQELKDEKLLIPAQS
jgi:hypothetical protein